MSGSFGSSSMQQAGGNLAETEQARGEDGWPHESRRSLVPIQETTDPRDGSATGSSRINSRMTKRSGGRALSFGAHIRRRKPA